MSAPPWTNVMILLELPSELPCISLPSTTNPCYRGPAGVKLDHVCTALCTELGTEDMLSTSVFISIPFFLGELA